MSLIFYKDNGTEEHIAGLNGQADLVSGKGVVVQDGEVSQTRDQLTFTGTRNEWDSLSLEQKAQYGIANITDDVASGVPIVVDAVTNGDMNPVTSNAVYDAVSNITPVDSVTNGQTKPPTSNAVFDLNSSALGNEAPLADNTDMITYLEQNSSVSRVTNMRFLCIAGLNTPYGATAKNVDFHCTVYRINDPNYVRVTALDVRNSNIFAKAKINGVWQSWHKVDNQEIIDSGTGFRAYRSYVDTDTMRTNTLKLVGRGTLSALKDFIDFLGINNRNSLGNIGVTLLKSQDVVSKNKYDNQPPSVSTRDGGEVLWFINPQMYFSAAGMSDTAIFASDSWNNYYSTDWSEQEEALVDVYLLFQY